jgi:hypothetical protein
MTFLSFLLAFGLLAVLHGVLDSNFKLCIFCYQWTHQGGDWETKLSVYWFDCEESLTCRCLNLNPEYFCSFTFILISCGETCLLVSWCACGRSSMTGSDEDHSRSRRPGAEEWGWSSTCQLLGGRAIRRSSDIVCGLHHTHEDEEHEFIGWASKSRSTVCQ